MEVGITATCEESTPRVEVGITATCEEGTPRVEVGITAPCEEGTPRVEVGISAIWGEGTACDEVGITETPTCEEQGLAADEGVSVTLEEEGVEEGDTPVGSEDELADVLHSVIAS